MAQALNLVVAKSVAVYDCDKIQKKADEISDEKDGVKLKKLYSKMLSVGNSRFLVRPSNDSTIQDLTDECPNFESVIEDILSELALCKKTGKDFTLYPILLAGDPGVGKTYFSQRLAACLEVPHSYQNMATMTAGWVLSGSSSSWSGAKCGKVAETLTTGEFANPVMLLDEIDKTGGDSRYDPFGVLLQLFEKHTAKAFKDEFLDIEVDGSYINWICTANYLEQIPAYIRDRMRVYEITKLSRENQIIQAARIFENLLKDNNLFGCFEPLSEEMLELCLGISTRELRKKLYDALSRAIRADRSYVSAEDLRILAKPKTTIGFIANN